MDLPFQGGGISILHKSLMKTLTLNFELLNDDTEVAKQTFRKMIIWRLETFLKG